MKVAILTSGGLAPCLSAAIGGLIKRYTEVDESIELIAYLNGYQGLLLGRWVPITRHVRQHAEQLLAFGGSPIGNSRVKLSNAKDCVKKGLITEGKNPFEVAAQQLIQDKVDILHTIGGDDTSTTAAELVHFLRKNNHSLQIVGLPKTIDNDIFPVRQSLGAWTAAEQGAIFFENIVHEHSATPGMLIVHEIMGRHCGWLAFETARCYTERLKRRSFVPELGFTREKFSIHGLFLPEVPLDLDGQAKRLKNVFERVGCVNLFVSEGACSEAIVKEMESSGEAVPRDAFGHVKLDTVNTGKWIGGKLSKALGAQKLLVQKSGYFARSAVPNQKDLMLIQSCVDFAVECALQGLSGLIGHDETNNDALRCIDFAKVKGGKLLNVEMESVKGFLRSIELL